MLVDLNTLKTVSNGFLQKINENSNGFLQKINENSNDFLQKINEKADKKEVVQSDWNQNDKNAKDYINNRTHWEEKKITEILPLTTLEFTSAGWEGGQSINSLSVVEGETYIVNWDGQEYPCICFSYSGLTLGNVSMLGGTDTGEPFLIFTSGTAFSSTIGTHTIAIQKEEDITIHQLDPKYIKDMYCDKTEEIFSVENAVFDGEFGEYFFEQPVVITEGKTYIVNWDGIEYTCEAYVIDGFSVIGGTKFGGNNEPFCIMYSKAENIAGAMTGNPSTHTFSIKESEIQTIPPKYIKDMYYDNGTIITEVLPETTIEGFTNAWDSIYLVENVIEMAPKVGMIYAVNWDGTEYITECKSYFDGIYIGNPNYLGGSFDGGIPFFIDFYFGGNSIITDSSDFSHTISITEVNHDLKQLDIKYLPIIEKITQTMFEMNDITGDGVFETSTDKILIGKHLVTIDGVSETLNFVSYDNDQSSFTQHSLGDIESFCEEDGKYAIYLAFLTSDTHSVKIEKINNFIKEENLPNSIARRPDWNQNDETASDFIKNKPFYKEENIEELIFEGEINFDEDGCYYFDPQIELKSGTKYTIVFNGLAYEEESYFDDIDYSIMIQVNTDCGRYLYISSGNLQIYGRKINAPCYFKIFIGSLHVAKKIEPMFIQEDDRKMSVHDPSGSGSFSMNIRNNAKIGSDSHAEGSGCEASGDASHAEGTYTTASGDSSHAEGLYTKALGRYSHAEGLHNFATTRSQNVTGEFNVSEDAYLSSETEIEASAYICSYLDRDNIYFCDGYTFDKNSGLYELVPIEYESVMNGYSILALRKNVYMIYGGKTGMVMYYGDSFNTAGTGSNSTIRLNIGGIKYEAVNNTTIRGKYAHIVGNGASDEERSNAHTLDWNGVGWFQNGLQVGGFAQDGDGVGYVPAIPAGASVGQTIVVKVVDENGKPTEWEAVDPWVITSSTEGSTKKFKLAVDDSGTITATEVT